MEIYPGSVCSLVGNGIHHCKDGILIKVRNDKMTSSNIRGVWGKKKKILT